MWYQIQGLVQLSSPVESVRVCVQQAAEQKSLDQVAGLQKSLEAFSEGILLVDTSTPDWDVLFQNEAWLRITGMSRDEVYGSKMWHLFAPADRTKVPCAFVAFRLHAFFGERPIAAHEQSLDSCLFPAAAAAGCQLLLLALTCCC